MGGALGDGLPLGQSSGTQFRTTPLWGLKSRLANNFGLLHDGRAATVNAAIQAHGGAGSEAATSILNFYSTQLTDQDRADVITFVSGL